VHSWAVEEFLKSHLKNRCAYDQKHGFLEDVANLDNQEMDDDDVDTADSDENAEDENMDEEEEVDGGFFFRKLVIYMISFS
jgi:hypothetical protein